MFVFLIILKDFGTFYTLQIAKVSKLLMEVEKGNIHLYKGKSLDEIEFDLEGNEY